MRYHTAVLSKKNKEAAYKELNSLDKALLERASEPLGAHIIALLRTGKPFKNKYGAKVFATTDQVLEEVDKLVRSGLLEIR